MIQIPLTNRAYSTYADNDYEWLLDYSWRAVKGRSGCEYAVTNHYNPFTRKYEDIRMHRIVLGCSPRDGVMVDHVNGDGLYNVTTNLRRATQTENIRNRQGLNKNNSLGFPGLEFRKNCRSKPWKATIYVDYQKFNLGYYATFDEAKAARIEAEQKYFGEFAPQRELDIVKSKVYNKEGRVGPNENHGGTCPCDSPVSEGQRRVCDN